MFNGSDRLLGKATGGEQASPPGTFYPTQIAKLYNFPSSVDGSGQCIGIIELGGGYRPADLKAYFQSLGLATPTVVPVSVDGGRYPR